MGPKMLLLLLLCFAVALRPGYCEPKSTGDEERARLPEFLTELDLASLEASEEDIEALKTVVKRLAPEKNVFFGNEELLNEWLKGAGVMGQPGVDFPALTTIPATTFSCRGLKGGYYADLETNCQVFHICDNGRKISFLCPNGTIFQQSQLICDWWFKVDCSKSAELYEQSAEHLAEEERKRSDAKRMKSEFHRSSFENDDNGNNNNNNNGGQNYYQSQNSDYDGRQNGRTNPFGQTPNKNQIPGSTSQRGLDGDSKSNTRGFDPNQIYSSNASPANQLNQINDLASGNSAKSRQQQQNQSPARSSSSSDRGNYRAVDRQQNQLVEGANEEENKRQFNYEQRGARKFPASNQNSYNNNNDDNNNNQRQQQQQQSRSNQQTPDYSSSNRNVGRENDGRNFVKSSSSSVSSSADYESSNRVTPSYTETTTFRTSTSSPIREYQQLAESAAFATNRGNRFNEAYSSSQFNSYYNFNNNGNNNNNSNNNGKARAQQKTTEKPRQKSITPTPRPDKGFDNLSKVRGGGGGGDGSQTLPFPTFQPIYKPRTSSNDYSTTTGYDSTTLGSTIADTVTTTGSPYANTDYYTQNKKQDPSSYTDDNFDYGTTTTTPLSYQTGQDFEATTETSNSDVLTEDYQRNSVTPSNDQTAITNTDFYENTTPTIITSGTYVNAKAYANSRVLSSISSGFTTAKPSSSSSYSKSQEYRQNSVATTGPINESTARRSEASSRYATTPSSYRDVTVEQNSVSSTRSQGNRDSNYQQGRALSKNSQPTNSPGLSYRQSQNSISSTTEKSSRYVTASSLQQSGATGKTLSPYDTSFTYQQGKVMSTLGPYVPFTKNYAYSTTTTSTTSKPPAYTATVPTYSSTASVYRSSSAKSLGGKSARASTPSPSVRPTGRIRGGSAAYLPEKKSDGSTYLSKKQSLNERPPTEREHALSMLQSLRGLEGTVPSLLGVINSTRSGLNIPPSSGPSTLHSLALYFATASDDYDSTAESRTDAAAELQSTEASGSFATEAAKGGKTSSEGVELPKTILTQHTINSYAELFNLNNALEGNSSSETNFNGYTDPEVSGEDSDDLDIQQSEGPIDGVRKSNSTKLRELAQVFTHALSAYLQDPDTFKKILTEIRPTEPSINSADSEEKFTATTFIPTTSEDYPSVTKEKDEVLDFSDDTTPPRGRRPTTIYPGTTTDLPTTTDAFTQQEYYTTSGDYYTTPSPLGTSGDNSNNQSGPDNNFAFQVNHAFGTAANAGNELSSGTGNGGLFYPEEATGPSDPLTDYGDNYFPTDDNNNNGGNKLGGFQNNTPSTYEPYGKHVKPFDATPIGDNYVASSTPATYFQNYQPEVAAKRDKASNQRYKGVPEDKNRSNNYQQSQQVTGKSQNSVSSYDARKRGSSSTRGKDSYGRKSPTTEPFRIRYYDTTTGNPRPNNQESLVTAGSVYSTYRDNYNDFADDNRKNNNNGITERPTYSTSVVTSWTVDPVTTRSTYTESGSSNTVTNNDDIPTTYSDENYNRLNDRKLNDHWTSSPTVTQLWESTVFVDPKRINQGLVSESEGGRGTTVESATIDYTQVTERSPASSDSNNQQESLVTDATSSGVSARRGSNNNVDYPSSPWKWADNNGNDNDSPTAFTLLPQTSYTTLEQQQQQQNIATATPSPIYTTRSSITTTITSSVTSTSSGGGTTGGQDGLPVSSSSSILQQTAKRPKHGAANSINEADNEIVKAHNMFGSLNTTSTNTLMKVMKQADSNATVRQLVLLLINHCNGPMNKTMEEEKEQLLDALLRMPVNEFTSEESRDLVEGINRLKLPIGRDDYNEPRSTSTTTSTTTTTTSTTEQPAITTFRSKKGRRFKSNAEEASSSSSSSARRGDDIGTAETSSNALSSEDTSASDARALELLRSLYTIAAKWG